MPATTRRRRSSRPRPGIAICNGTSASFAACEPAASRQIEAELGPGRRAGQQCRHHPRRHVPQDDARAMERGHQHQPQLAVQHDPPGVGGHARRAASAGSSTSPRSTARRARWARPTTRPPRPAIIGFVKALAQEGAAKGITVNCHLRPAISTPRWCAPCRRRCWTSISCRDPGRPARRARGDRALRGVPRRR